MNLIRHFIHSTETTDLIPSISESPSPIEKSAKCFLCESCSLARGVVWKGGGVVITDPKRMEGMRPCPPFPASGLF